MDDQELRAALAELDRRVGAYEKEEESARTLRDWEMSGLWRSERWRSLAAGMAEAIKRIRAALQAEAPAPAGLDAAWAEAEAAMPTRWAWTVTVNPYDAGSDEWRYEVRGYDASGMRLYHRGRDLISVLREAVALAAQDPTPSWSQFAATHDEPDLPPIEHGDLPRHAQEPD